MKLIKFSVTEVMIMPIVMKELTENQYLDDYTPYISLWECGFKSAKMRGYDLILEFDDRVNQTSLFNDYYWGIEENTFNEILLSSKYFKEYDGRYIYDLSEFKEYIDIIKTSEYSKADYNVVSMTKAITPKRSFGYEYYQSNIASYIIKGEESSSPLRTKFSKFLKDLGVKKERFKAWQEAKEEVQ